MSPKKYSRAGIVLNVLASTVLIIVSILIVVYRQRILDQISYWQFQSNSQLDSLVEKSGMNDYGKFLYLASQPTLDATQNFNVECARIENTVSILGCYTNRRIYVYDVTASQLDGIREVTAAHETLHAAYERLSSSDKQKVNVLLENEYKKLQSSKAYADRMAFYARTEPGDRDNELHSVVGTEISDISAELENYYKRYFSNRQSSVKLYVKYSSVFTKLKERADSLSGQLKSLSASINTRANEYNDSVVQLNADIQNFNNAAKNGGFDSQTQFNAARVALVNRVSEIESLRSSINADISKYDSLLAEYNSNAAQSTKLYNSIDSTLAPAPSV